ncbi:TPA: inovirus-type Gp2 protein [Proteus mirabilis]
MNNYLEHTERLTIDDMDLPVYSKKGPLIPSCLLAIKSTFDRALDQYPRTLFLRFDLRYPQGFSSEKVSSKQITKFQESFKAIMYAYLKRKTHNRHSKPRFIWYIEADNPQLVLLDLFFQRHPVAVAQTGQTVYLLDQ